MKIEWQAEDILAGRIVGKPGRVERWLIGYTPDVADQSKRWALISLSDGMVAHHGDTAEALAARLNAAGDMPVEFFSDPSHVKRGQKGGAARSQSLSPERRTEIASDAARARWNGNQ